MENANAANGRLTINSDYFPTVSEIPGDHEYNDRYYIETGSNGATYKKKWCLLGEITEANAIMRPRLMVRDRTGTSFVVALYFDNNVDASRILSKFKRGYTVAMMTALGHNFLDGSAGVRVEDEDEITVSAIPSPFP